jgi:hypothetical protein
MNKGAVWGYRCAGLVTTALVLNLIAHINRLHGLDRLLMYLFVERRSRMRGST